MPLLSRTIVIDAGHGGPDPGAVGAHGELEKDVTLAVALDLAEYLRQSGARVLMVRTDDRDLADPELGRAYSRRKRQDLVRRAELMKNSQPDVAVSIHVNAIASPYWRGAQVFYPANQPDAKLLASQVQSSLVELLKNTDRGVKVGDYYLLKQGPDPTVLAEVGFLSNPEEASLLTDSAYQDKVAWALFLGVVRFLGSPAPLPAEN
jgi:N-acetylmuramoyl-L-alanine amidase